MHRKHIIHSIYCISKINLFIYLLKTKIHKIFLIQILEYVRFFIQQKTEGLTINASLRCHILKNSEIVYVMQKNKRERERNRITLIK